MQQAVGLHTFLTSWNWWSNQENDTFLKTILIASNQCFSRVRLPKKKYLLQPRQNMSCAELPVGMLQTHLIFSGSGPKTRVTWLKKKKILFPKVSTNQLPMRVKILIRKCATIASSTTNHSGKQTSLLFNFPRDWPWEHAIPQLFVQKKNRKLVNYHRHQIQQSRAWLILSKINKQLHLDPFRQRAALLISACSKQPEVISCVFFLPILRSLWISYVSSVASHSAGGLILGETAIREYLILKGLNYMWWKADSFLYFCLQAVAHPLANKYNSNLLSSQTIFKPHSSMCWMELRANRMLKCWTSPLIACAICHCQGVAQLGLLWWCYWFKVGGSLSRSRWLKVRSGLSYLFLPWRTSAMSHSISNFS